MHREYNKRLKEIKHSKDKAEIYDRFYGDSQYADQVVRAWAQQNGFTLAKSGEVVQNTQQNQQQGQKAPSQLVEAFKAKLPPELHWMAESQADAFWAAQQMMMAPLQKQQQEGQLAARNQEYDTLAEELAEVAPEWEDREDDMTELLGFLTSPDMKHKKFGSKLSLLYNVLTGNAAAISQVTNRMNKGIKNKNTNGNRTIQNTKPNLADRIRKASKEDAWALAVKSAEGSE
jgi:DNA-binding transcriptional MerR regulator